MLEVGCSWKEERGRALTPLNLWSSLERKRAELLLRFSLHFYLYFNQYRVSFLRMYTGISRAFDGAAEGEVGMAVELNA